jgi:hypothetical protein
MPKPKTFNLPSECEDLHFTHNAFKHGAQLFHGNTAFSFLLLRQNQRHEMHKSVHQ